MEENAFFSAREGPQEDIASCVKWSRLDLVVLRAMAKKLYVTLRALELPSVTSPSLYYSFEERRGRQHRMVIYAPCELLEESDLRFVGFVSRRSRIVDPRIVAELFRVDQQMLREIVCVPGLLSYSSLELHPGNWYNLILFRDAAVKIHVRALETHRYAAHHLSPDYYEWIRLHNGEMSGGLTHLELSLHSTKQYHFCQEQHSSIVREYLYERYSDA